MPQSEPTPISEPVADLTARLVAAERTLAARDKTIEELSARGRDQSGKTVERTRLQTAALEAASDGIAIVDRSGTIEWINRGFTRLTGYSAEDAIGRNPSILKSGQHPDAFYQQMWETVSQGRIWKGEIINRHKSGRLYHEELTLTPVCDAGGAVTHFIAIKQDLSGRKKLEEAKQRQQDELRVLFELVPAMIWFKDTENGFVRVNQRMAEATGRPVEEIQGKSASEVFPLEGDSCYADDLEVIRSGVPRMGIVGKLRGPEGRELCIQTDKVPVLDSDGKVTGLVAVAHDITARTLMETALRDSEERFSGAFEHAPIGIALVSPDGRFLKVNRALCNLVGFSEAELLTRTFQDITHPEDLEADLENLHRLTAGEIGSYQMEKRYLHASGNLVSVLLDVSLVRNDQGQPVYFISQIQDISARKRSEESQRAQRERYLLQRNALIAFTCGSHSGEDLEATIRKLTETNARTLGVARVSVWRYNSDRTAIRCADLYELEADRHSSGTELSAADYPAYFQALTAMEVIRAEDAHRDPRTCEFSGNYLRPLGITSMLDVPIHLGGDGEGVLCYEHVGPPRQWTADEDTFAVAVANRISLPLEGSERQRAENELRDALAQIEQMLAYSPAIIFRLKVEGERLVPIAASDNITAVLGYTLAEALTAEWWLDRLHPDDREMAFKGMRELMKQGTNRFEYRMRHKEGGYRWIEDNQRVLRDISGKPMETVGVWMDISERKEAEAKFEKLNKELVEISRQAGMAEVASSVLHNVGNVLNSVNVSCTMVADKLRKSRISGVRKTAGLLQAHADDLAAFLTRDPVGRKLPDFLGKLAGRLSDEQDEVLRELELLDRNIEHIKDIVAMQQSFAKVSGTAETLNIADLVEDALRMNADSTKHHDIQIVREFRKMPPVTVDKHKMLQILVNLLCNAKQACDDSGRAEKRLTLRGTHKNNLVQVTVTDNGIGIPPENLTRIFAHGFTTRKDGHGFGLHGSALAAREMGGSLSVHSDGPGTGAAFTVELPLVPGGTT